MRTAVRLAGFAAALALVFGAAWAAGTVTGRRRPAVPSDRRPARRPRARHAAAAARHDGGGRDQRRRRPTPASTGLVATAAGYTLVPQATTFTPGRAGASSAFAITGSDGRPVTAFDVEHDGRCT